MKIKLILITVITILAFCESAPQKKFEKNCAEVERVILKNGESFLNNCDSAYVMNRTASNRMYGILEQKSAIIDTLEKQKSILKNIISLNEKEINSWKQIVNIQDTSYNRLKRAQEATSILVKNSIENTNHALSYAKKIKYSSYLTSFVMGGVAGGLIDNNKYSFGAGGALIGAFSGALINYLLQEIILGD